MIRPLAHVFSASIWLNSELFGIALLYTLRVELTARVCTIVGLWDNIVRISQVNAVEGRCFEKLILHLLISALNIILDISCIVLPDHIIQVFNSRLYHLLLWDKGILLYFYWVLCRASWIKHAAQSLGYYIINCNTAWLIYQ